MIEKVKYVELKGERLHNEVINKFNEIIETMNAISEKLNQIPIPPKEVWMSKAEWDFAHGRGTTGSGEYQNNTTNNDRQE